MNISDSDTNRPVLGNNKTRSTELRSKSVTKVKNNHRETTEDIKGKKSPALCKTTVVPSILRKQHSIRVLRSNLSMNASCSSDASSDSSHSRASTGRIRSQRSVPIQRKQCGLRNDKVVDAATLVDSQADAHAHADAALLLLKKRCAWVTPNTGMPIYSLKTIIKLCCILTNYMKFAV